VSRDREEGVILINVLVILSLAATVVYVMLTLADVAIARSQGFRDAGEGLALVQGAEQFAIAALRRDMIEAPDTDNAAEPWNRLAQDAIDIPGGTLELRIEDAQGLFNVNVIAAERAQGEETLRLIGEAAGLPPEVISRIATSLDLDGPVRRIADLGDRAAGQERDEPERRAGRPALAADRERGQGAAPRQPARRRRAADGPGPRIRSGRAAAGDRVSLRLLPPSNHGAHGRDGSVGREPADAPRGTGGPGGDGGRASERDTRGLPAPAGVMTRQGDEG
jgi:hypothetical protein